MAFKGDNSLDAYDKKTEITFTVDMNGAGGSGGVEINFQFPPKILSESNESLWMPFDVWSAQAVRIQQGAAGRKITMEWEYLVSREWGPTDIAFELINLKKYFYDFNDEFYPLVHIRYTEVISITTDFRLMALNIIYSPEIVSGDASAGSNGTFPLHTKVSCQLMLAFNLGELQMQKPLRGITTLWY